MTNSRRTKGAGSITKVLDSDGKQKRVRNPDGKFAYLWLVRASINQDGERRRASRKVRGTKNDAEKALKSLQSELRDGVRVDKQSSLYFGAYAKEWHQIRIEKGKLAATSLKREGDAIKTLCTYWEDKKLADITPKMIERLYLKITADKIEELGHYSTSSLAKVHICLNQIMKDALNNDLIAKNPCERVEKPTMKKGDRTSLTASQARTLLAKLDEAENMESDAPNSITGHGVKIISRGACFTSVRVALATGMRLGEVCALRWSDVSLVKSSGFFGVIRVRRSLDRYGNEKEPKTKAGIRDVTLDRGTAERLSAWKDKQAAELKAIGVRQRTETPVFANNLGELMTTNQLSSWWRRWRVWAGFPQLHFHELRHTSATLLLTNGVDIKTVQKRGGWASSQILLDVYAHALKEADQKAASVLGGLFAEPEPKTASERPQKAEILTA